MRSTEFTFDSVIDTQWAHICETIPEVDYTALFESFGDTDLITTFISSAAEDAISLSAADIGKHFFPVSYMFIPPMKRIFIAKFSGDAELVDLSRDSSAKFMRGLSSQTFPISAPAAGRYTLIFRDEATFEYIELIRLQKFSEWSTGVKII